MSLSSKNAADIERLLVINPELADVLSAIIAKIRQSDGMVPLVPFYDEGEKGWGAPSSLLFRWVYGGIEASAISAGAIRRAIREILADIDLLDTDGQPLYFVPHDLRRIFTTEAILNGMPPHIAQILLGRNDINTTMGYKTVYPEEAISGHRAFIARRRPLRQTEEYRTPTDAEWDEFLEHFERRKVALGECGRAANAAELGARAVRNGRIADLTQRPGGRLPGPASLPGPGDEDEGG
ncbi:site-specific integrase [Nocardia albiluteola]|nr:site-specific integrase [Nocardia albiluteola]